MENKIVLIIMDMVVLLALGGTMYFMSRISSGIKILRDGKSELQQLLQQLNIHISNAQHAIENMNKLADDKAKLIQKQIESATAATEELQFIQRAADNVAVRLEKLTGQVATKADEAPKAASRAMSKAEKELSDAMAARRAGTKGE
jgi:ABC-type transporter Mla subunit MlaD